MLVYYLFDDMGCVRVLYVLQAWGVWDVACAAGKVCVGLLMC